MDKTVIWCKIFSDLKSAYHSVAVQDLGLLGYDAVLLDEWLDCLTYEDGSTMIHQNIGNHAPSDTALCVRIPESWNQNYFKVFPFFGVTILLSCCVILGLCTCCNKYITLFYMVSNYCMFIQIGCDISQITDLSHSTAINFLLRQDWTLVYLMEFACGKLNKQDHFLSFRCALWCLISCDIYRTSIKESRNSLPNYMFQWLALFCIKEVLGSNPN
jgi:hypothetical protein